MEKMISIKEVSKWFLYKESMNKKKLECLCYFAYAWSLVFNIKIKDCKFQAINNGIKNEYLDSEYSKYGYDLIPKNDKPSIDNEMNEFLELIWVTYEDICDHELNAIIMSELPWLEAKLDPKGKNVINEDTLKKCYEKQLTF